MLQRLMLLGLFCGLMAAATGCGLCHNILCEPFGPGSICTTNNCGHDCLTGCTSGCADACGAVGEGSCESSCGDVCGGSCGRCANPCAPCGPLTFVAKLLHPQAWKCGSCDSEVYWGDFHGDPPECCDPCDRCGNFTGATTDGCNNGNCGGGQSYNSMQYSSESGGCSTCGTNTAPSSYGPQTASRNPYRLTQR